MAVVGLPDVPTVAMAVLLLLHVPPVDASDNVIVWPTHTAAFTVGVIASTAGLIFKVVVAVQPPPIVYVIVMSVGGPIAVTTPDDDPTVARAELLLDHVPPPVAFVNV